MMKEVKDILENKHRMEFLSGNNIAPNIEESKEDK
jgi:hypothetical protein